VGNEGSKVEMERYYRVRRLLDGLRTAEVGDPLRRDPWHWPVLIAWTALWFSAKAAHGGQSWHFSVQGAQLLWEGAGSHQAAGGLNLFANYPRLQSGPLTFALAEPITWLAPHNGLVAAELVMTLLGLLVLYAVERAAFAVRPDVPASRIRWTVLGGGALLVPLWALTGVGYAHFDDVLALTFAALAVWAAAERKAVLVGVCVGLAVDSKPWAAAFLPLLFAVPGSIRIPGGDRRRAVLVCLALVVAAWLPFMMADPNSLNAATFTIVNVPDSALRALGVHDPRTPGWDRSAQIVFGCLFGSLAVWRGRWPAAVLIGVCARIALEPNDYAYYFAGLLLGALCWDLLSARRPQPLMTLSVTVLVFALPSIGVSPQVYGDIKLWTMIGATLASLLGPAAALSGRRARLGSVPGDPVSAALEAASRTLPARDAPALDAPIPDAALAHSRGEQLSRGLGHDSGGQLRRHGLVTQVPPREHSRPM
jgi:hypothetical protein